MNPSMLRPYSLHVDTYPAFPKLENDIIKTKQWIRNGIGTM